jgi:predicted metal-binding membrane protein
VHHQSTLSSLLSRPNRLLFATLLLLIALAWLQLFSGRAADDLTFRHAHPSHYSVTGLASPVWELRDFGTAFLMWVLMAVAMMLPTAAPAILAFADIARAGHRTPPAGDRIAAFILGYLLAWWGFATLATLAQWGIATAALHFSLLDSERSLLGGAVLTAAGLYQFSALKELCLAKCRSPIAFFLTQWRDGARGAIHLGLRHGIHCVGCCWALMALMLFAGTMSIGWTAGLGAVMLAEKIAPAGRTAASAFGVGLIVSGGVLIASASLGGELP